MTHWMWLCEFLNSAKINIKLHNPSSACATEFRHNYVLFEPLPRIQVPTTFFYSFSFQVCKEINIEEIQN